MADPTPDPDPVRVRIRADRADRPYHVRDEEARVGALAPCALPAADRAALRPVAFGPRPGTLWLPAPERAEAIDVPDDTWQGWAWPDGGSILLYAHADPGLPRLHAVTWPRPELCRVVVAGRPMRARRLAPGAPGWAGTGHVAEVDGFLDEATCFWAQLEAPTPEQRDGLVAALCTLELAPAGAGDGAGARGA